MGNFTAVIEQSLRQWRDARRRVLRRHAGREAVHAWRVASRRLHAMEQLLAPHPLSRRGATMRKCLHEAFHAAGELRDAQLAMRQLQSLTATFAAASRLERHLERQLRERRRVATDCIRDIKPRVLRAVAAAWQGSSAQRFEPVAALRAAHRLADAQRVSRRSPQQQGNAATIHRLRIRLKLLRYMTELHRAAGCRAIRMPPLPRLASWQVQLGKITDIQVLLKSMQRYGSRHRKWWIEATSLRRHLQRRRRQLLDQLVAQFN